jgi:hypothetical protein
VTATVTAWRAILAQAGRPSVLPLPHPSWRNSGWLKRHAWFEAELVPHLRELLADLLPKNVIVADAHLEADERKSNGHFR